MKQGFVGEYAGSGNKVDPLNERQLVQEGTRQTRAHDKAGPVETIGEADFALKPKIEPDPGREGSE